ncbi:MAG: YCF48-related protein [Acidobacteriota bacterium]
MVSFADTMIGWACSDSSIFKTSDGGISWTLEKRQYGFDPALAGIAAIDTSTVYAVDMSGVFYVFSSGKMVRTSRGFPASQNTTLQFLTKEIGYGGGPTGLYKTTNAGATWEKQTGSFNGRLTKIDFPNETIGYAADNNKVSKTTDGGYTWNTLPGIQYSVYGLDAVDSLELWVAQLDTVAHSNDGGHTWEKIHFDSAFVRNVNFFDHDFGILYDVWREKYSSGSAILIVTTDGGKSWVRYPLPAVLTGMTKLFFISRNEGWLASQQALYHTTDGARTWQAVLRGQYGNLWNMGAFSFDFIDSASGWFAYYGRLYKTSDGGISWKESALPVEVEIHDVKFINKQIGWAVGDDGMIFSTSDGGETWSVDAVSIPYDLFSICAIPRAGKTGIRIGGDGFTILAHEYATRVGEHDESVPADLFLFRNYPNPFNPSTKITFDLPKAGRVRITIFDALGREVKTLLDQHIAKGRHAITFEANGLPNGMYLCRIQSGGFIQIGKMLLMK